MDGANDISASRFAVDRVRTTHSASGGAGELKPRAQEKARPGRGSEFAMVSAGRPLAGGVSLRPLRWGYAVHSHATASKDDGTTRAFTVSADWNRQHWRCARAPTFQAAFRKRRPTRANDALQRAGIVRRGPRLLRLANDNRKGEQQHVAAGGAVREVGLQVRIGRLAVQLLRRLVHPKRQQGDVRAPARRRFLGTAGAGSAHLKE